MKKVIMERATPLATTLPARLCGTLLLMSGIKRTGTWMLPSYHRLPTPHAMPFAIPTR